MYANEGSANGNFLSFTAKLPIPPTANNLFVNNRRTGGRFTSPEYKAWQEEAKLDLEFWKQYGPMKGRLKAVYTYVFKDDRKRDIGNFEKAISDILVKGGVIKDDSQIDHLELIRSTGGNPGVKIELYRLPQDTKHAEKGEVP